MFAAEKLGAYILGRTVRQFGNAQGMLRIEKADHVGIRVSDEAASICPNPSLSEHTSFLLQRRVGNARRQTNCLWQRGGQSYSLIGDNRQ